MSRYWVGGTGNWTDATNHWATSSGGTPDVGNLPTSSDDVIIDSSSGFASGGIITLNNGSEGEALCHDFTSTSGHSYNIEHATEDPSEKETINISGSMSLESGVTFDPLEWIKLSFTSDSQETVDAGGANLPDMEFVSGINGTGEFTFTSNINSHNVYFETATINVGEYDLTSEDIETGSEAGGVINMGSGTWTSERFHFTSDNTVNKEQSTILINGPDETYWGSFTGGGLGYQFNKITVGTVGFCSFDGIFTTNILEFLAPNSGKKYMLMEDVHITVDNFIAVGQNNKELIFASGDSLGCIWDCSIDTAGSGYEEGDTVIVSSGNADALIYIDAVDGSGGVTEFSINFSGSGYSVSDSVSISGGSGSGFKIDILEVSEDSPDLFSISSAAGVHQCDYLILYDSYATGGAKWYAGSNSVDRTNNAGWIFEDAPVAESCALPLFLI